MRQENSQKKRILFLNAGGELYGSDQSLLGVVSGLDRSRFEPFVILNSPGPLVERLHERGIETAFMRLGIIRRKYFNPRGMLNRTGHLSRATAALVRQIRRGRFDLIYSNTSNIMAGAMAAWLTSRFHLLHLREILVSPEIVWRFLARYFTTFSHQIIANSTAVRDHLKAEVPRAAGKTVVIHNGVDIERFKPHRDRAALRRSLGLTDEHVAVAVVGRVNPRKGQEILIKSAAALAERNSNLRWFIIGGAFAGEEIYRQQLIEDVRRRGLDDRITFIEFHPAIEKVYASIDILALPSLAPESFGLVLAEAMACEVPVIATRQGGPLDVVAEGETGLFVRPGDVRDLAEAVARLADDAELRRRMGKAGRARVKRLFTLEILQARINNLLVSFFEKRRGLTEVPAARA